MKALEQYYTKTAGLLQRIAANEQKSIDDGAGALIACLKREGRIWIIGPGVHSYIGVEEMCYRSGGIFNIHPLECNMLSLGGVKAWTATMMERTPGLALSIFKASGVARKDLVIVYNQYGINPVAIESALTAKAMGIPVIGITSSEFCKDIAPDHPARHPAGLDLCDIVDIHINSWMPPGDALVELEGIDTPVAACSTIVGVFALNLLVARTVERAAEEYPEIRLTRCGNTPGGDEYNKKNMVELGDSVGYGGSKGRDQSYPAYEEIEKLATEVGN